MFKDVNRGVIILAPTHYTWEARFVIASELDFDRELAKVEPTLALKVKTKQSVFFRRTVHAVGVSIQEKEIPVELFAKVTPILDMPFVSEKSERVKENVEKALRNLGQHVVRFDKADAALSVMGIDWVDPAEEDEIESITHLKAVASSTNEKIEDILKRFSSKVSEGEESEWLSIPDFKKTGNWDSTLDTAFTCLFEGKEIPEVVTLNSEPVEEEIIEEEDDDTDALIRKAQAEHESNVVVGAFQSDDSVDEESIN